MFGLSRKRASRGFDLRKYDATAAQLEALKPHSGYQPMIFSDDCHAGIAHNWMYGSSKLRVVRRNDVEMDVWNEFTRLNEQMRNMYEDWLDALVDALGGSIAGMSGLEIGTDQGYFLYGLKERGAGPCDGYDATDKSESFRLLNEITGHDCRFHQAQYDQYKHEVSGAAPADIVISSAFMCHLSDPTYYLAYIGKLARKAILLFSTIDNDPGFKMRFLGHHMYLTENPFPVCFDALNYVSRGFIDLGLKEMGFNRVIALPYRKSWVPHSWFKDKQVMIAIRDSEG